MSRIELQAAADLYVDPNGDDVGGDGSISDPWASPMGAFDHLITQYDLRGFPVRVHCADGVYTQTNQFEGLIPGQRSAQHLQFLGNIANPRACIIRPSTGYSFSIGGGGGVRIDGFYMDQLSADGGAGQDTTAVDFRSEMVWGDQLVFGPNINPWNHCSCVGLLRILGGRVNVGTPQERPMTYVIDPELQYRTWSSSGPTTWLTIGSLTGIRLWQGVNGPYQHPLAHVVELDAGGGRVRISHATSNGGAISNQGVNFSNGAQCHILAGEGAIVMYVTNGQPNLAKVTLIHAPHFYDAFLTAYQGSRINYPYGVAFENWAMGKRYRVEGNAVIDIEAAGHGLTTQQGEDFLPGSAAGTKATGGQYV